MKPICGYKTGNPVDLYWSRKKHSLRWKQMRVACLRYLKRGAKQALLKELRHEYGSSVR